VLPRYANTHTESSGTGLQTTRLREDARARIKSAVNADDRNLPDLLRIRIHRRCQQTDRHIESAHFPPTSTRRYALSSLIPAAERPVVFIGPYEHHSNELPWRESIADVVPIPEDGRGSSRRSGACASDSRSTAIVPLRIGSFSAASNVTGILTDTHAISSLLHQYGALAFWDYAASGPYVDIDMQPRCTEHPLSYKDAVFLSPHKFIGGPGTPGVLLARRELLGNSVPDTVGGGTVAYVNTDEHVYVDDPEHREEGGTPAIVESIRAGLVFDLKERVGVEVIRAREDDFVRRAIDSWRSNPVIEVLGNTETERLSIVSFVVRRDDDRYLHHNFVVAVLNDLFGIQSRGGCSCAGPYGHRLLGIDLERSWEFQREITHGCEGIKPGWTRINFNYFISEPVFDYFVQAVHLTAEFGHRLLPRYRFDATSGLWQHIDGPVEPPLRLAQLHYDNDGRLTYPVHHDRAPESALESYLDEACASCSALCRRTGVGRHPARRVIRFRGTCAGSRWLAPTR
jgi:selenocysteine lyase/cysteine desulfurase